MKKFAESLTGWYEENKRDLPWRRTRDPYRIWVSEIMLQQTRVEAVRPYYDRFLAALPDLTSLAAADGETLNKLWQGLGYYSRVRNMKKAAQTCAEQYGGRLPERCEELKKLSGIGDYTAAAIASFAFGEAVPAIDGNVRRVVARYLALETPAGAPQTEKAIRAFLEKEIPKEAPAAFNYAVMELGATLCGPDRAPRCGGCPLLTDCKAFEKGLTEVLPVRAPKGERRTEERTPLVLLTDDGRAALVRRPDKGLLAGLWDLPTLEGFCGEAQVRAYLEDEGCRVLSIEKLPPARHIFTHIVWEMRGYLVRVTDGGGFAFYSAEERRARALPSALKPFFNYLI